MDANGKKFKSPEPPVIYAEVAKTEPKHTLGLMYRKYLPKNSGMLFDFGKEKPLSFWMANTYIPLQVAFIKDNGKIGQIERMYPLSTRSIRSNGEYRYALEVNDGWFDDNKIKIGAQASLPGQLQQAQQPQQTQQAQQPQNPDVSILLANKDILEQIKNYKKINNVTSDAQIQIIIEYITKEDVLLPAKTIETPFDFKDTKEGDTNGLLIAWDVQDAGWKCFTIENILSIRDSSGNIIQNEQQLNAYLTQLFKNEGKQQ